MIRFDDPIFLDPEPLEELLLDTEQRRICWMYHDVLSDPQIAWMFDHYAGERTPGREGWTTMAWVAPTRRQGCFYVLFKWYEDFYGPPNAGELYHVQRTGQEIRVRLVSMGQIFHHLGRRGQALHQTFLTRVSENATAFFGDFSDSPVQDILRTVDENPKEELETLDWFLGRRSDGEKSVQCAAVAVYFNSLRAVHEIIYHIVTAQENGEGRRTHTREFLEILNRIIAGPVDVKRLGELTELFEELAEGFCPEANRGCVLDRVTGRLLTQWTEDGAVRWIRLGGSGRQKLLRELYSRSNPRRVWDVFHRWRGDLYFTVFHRPPGRGLCRGVYLLSRFQDQQGQVVTDFFWLENLNGGSVHLCDGEFFESMQAVVRARTSREITLHGGRRRSEDLIATYFHLLKEAFDKMDRGRGPLRPSEKEKIF